MSEVIIDGCNVAECKYYVEDNGIIAPDGTPERTSLCTSPEKSCENSDCCVCNPNCYFKQLQRAKAEKQDLINYYELREGGMLEDIQYWKNKAQEFYKELEEYKKSKQASYENMQAEWNKAVNELRDVKAENEKLKLMLSEKYGAHRGCLII